MPRYRIHRIKEGPKETFRWASHTGGLAIVKAKDYESGEEREAGNPYEIWKLMLTEGQALEPGDLLEVVPLEPANGTSTETLFIAKYIGFEPAQWFVPEPKPLIPAAPAETASAISS
ncbi:MAG TPA: hypothetical protein VHZ55_22740 [Bryobacteraceae bacterium]|jgi:hypothetical protein|nr:hypothetical protein [Bryobacteraceae bacterium]